MKKRCEGCGKRVAARLFHGSDRCVSCRVKEASEQAKAIKDDVDISDLFEVAK